MRSFLLLFMPSRLTNSVSSVLLAFYIWYCTLWISTVLLYLRFGGKEEYMGFMNGFVEKEFVNMRKFLEEISVSYAVVL